MFEPIAIIGRACLLPGALSPEQLWQNTLAAVDCLDHATKELWGIAPTSMLTTSAEPRTTDLTWTDRTGYIKGFAGLFNPHDFALPAQQILQWDVLQQWLLHTGRKTLQDAGYTLKDVGQLRAGAIIGNLSYPTQSLAQFAESVWLKNQHQFATLMDKDVFARAIHPDNRFMSGLPIFCMAQGLGLTGEAFAIDAACASSLYAIKLACDQLQEGAADLMLAGGVNAADSLFLQMGFTALQALSKTGRSLPLHCEADGLIPAQGVALVALKRLPEAVRDSDQIYGVIRGIGLSNDGAGSGLLVPHSSGQVAAMQQAYAVSGLSPEDISWVECHATGTSLGDATEIRSMQQVFSPSGLELGALKANIGHSITASGAAALINVLSAFAAQTKPPVRAAAAQPALILQESGFRLLAKPSHWDHSAKPRCAAINCFGFGGNNAHLVVEEWRGRGASTVVVGSAVGVEVGAAGAEEELGELGCLLAPNATSMSLRIASCNPVARLATQAPPALLQHQQHQLQLQQQIPPQLFLPLSPLLDWVYSLQANNKTEFVQALWGEQLVNENSSQTGHIESISLPIQGTPFPPDDLKRTLGQQLALLKASQEALAEIKRVDPNRTAVLVGMQCDADITRSGLRWRLPALLPNSDQAWLDEVRDVIHWPLQPADVIGCMPNIVTNRINHVFNFKAPSYSVSAEEISGITALKIAMRDLQHRAIDMAIVGAVDMCCEVVHQVAAKAVLPPAQHTPGDAAVVLVLKRLEDAEGEMSTAYFPQNRKRLGA